MHVEKTESLDRSQSYINQLSNRYGQDISSTWKRAIFEVPEEKLASLLEVLRSSAAGELIPAVGEKLPDFSGEEYFGTHDPYIVTDEPVVAHIEVESFKGMDGIWYDANFKVALYFTGENESTASLTLSHGGSSEALYRNVFIPEYMETGYEGHAQKSIEPEQMSLGGFLQLVDRYRGKQNIQPTLEESMSSLVLKGEDGTEFRYDSEKKRFVDYNGVGLEDSFSGSLRVIAEEFRES